MEYISDKKFLQNSNTNTILFLALQTKDTYCIQVEHTFYNFTFFPIPNKLILLHFYQCCYEKKEICSTHVSEQYIQFDFLR